MTKPNPHELGFKLVKVIWIENSSTQIHPWKITQFQPNRSMIDYYWLHEGCFDFCVELTVVQTKSFNLRKTRFSKKKLKENEKKKKNAKLILSFSSYFIIKKELSETVSLTLSHPKSIQFLFSSKIYAIYYFDLLF